MVERSSKLMVWCVRPPEHGVGYVWWLFPHRSLVQWCQGLVGRGCLLRIGTIHEGEGCLFRNPSFNNVPVCSRSCPRPPGLRGACLACKVAQGRPFQWGHAPTKVGRVMPCALLFVDQGAPLVRTFSDGAFGGGGHIGPVLRKVQGSAQAVGHVHLFQEGSEFRFAPWSREPDFDLVLSEAAHRLSIDPFQGLHELFLFHLGTWAAMDAKGRVRLCHT